MNPKINLKKVKECIKNHDNFLITAHVNLEGDALGAELAFLRLIKKLGKKGVVVNEDKTPLRYAFLPGVDMIKKPDKSLRRVNFDCFAILDCSDISRCGRVATLYKKDMTMLNIDHHISNTGFGDIKWVKPSASSASELVYQLYKEFSVSLDKISATLLYVGILTDTGSFRYSNTKSYTHQVASDLISCGVDVVSIYRQTYGNIPYRQMKLLFSLLKTMRKECSGKIIWFQINSKRHQDEDMAIDLAEYLINFGRAIKGVEVVVVFKRNLSISGQMRVNFRSQGGKVDVNKIASFFGGGGHKSASGATINGKTTSIRNKVLKKIKESF